MPEVSLGNSPRYNVVVVVLLIPLSADVSHMMLSIFLLFVFGVYFYFLFFFYLGGGLTVSPYVVSTFVYVMVANKNKICLYIMYFCYPYLYACFYEINMLKREKH